VDELLFVYGTLRKETNHAMSVFLANRSEFLGRGLVHGELYDFGPYPGLFVESDSSERVVGELYKLAKQSAPDTLQLLDRYEKCGPDDQRPHQYTRVRVCVVQENGEEVDAWAYVLNRRPPEITRIAGGDYVAWQRAKNST
jgi:gamma-glutamylcyclotransferase (GGCT)/AIG2-like uncharacterized protein YtfP